MKKTIGLLILLFCTTFSNAFAMPAQVILIRHAEKPAGEETNGLSERGWQRAHALVDFFTQEKAVLRYGPPVAIYGFGPHRPGASVRGIQTVQPLADALSMRVIKDYTRDETKAAAYEILNAPAYDGKMVLICWQHDNLRNFATALGFADAPKWGKVFDRAWILDYAQGRVVGFSDIPQRLLPGDSVD